MIYACVLIFAFTAPFAYTRKICQDGICENTPIVLSNVSTINGSHELSGFYSPRDYCEKKGMRTTDIEAGGCRLGCFNLTDGYISVHNLKDGNPCENIGACQDGECKNMLIVLRNEPSTNASDKLIDFKSPMERCHMLGMNLIDIFNGGCRILCSSKGHVLGTGYEDGLPCNNNGICQDGKCKELTVVLSNIPSTNTSVELSGFKSPSERCNMMGMILIGTYADGCRILCHNETDKIYQNSDLEDGYPCNNNGFCIHGKCNNKTTTSTTDSTFKTTTTALDENESFCLDGKCNNMTTTSTTDSTFETTTPSNIRKSPEERCNAISMIWIYDYNYGCSITCHDEIGNFYHNVVVENGYPCDNNGTCRHGMCENMTIVTNPSDELTKFKSPSERCNMIGRFLAYTYADGCMILCHNKTKNFDKDLFALNGYPCANNGTCDQGHCNNMSIVSSNIPSTYPSDQLRGFLSPSVRCNIEGMTLASTYNHGCGITCYNEIENFTKDLYAQVGYPCANNGTCDSYRCQNMSIVSRNISSTNASPDTETTLYSYEVKK